jgi:hypothetical protein
MSYINIPSTLIEFEQLFNNDESCLKYIIQLRWPDGFFCQKCNCKKY